MATIIHLKVTSWAFRSINYYCKQWLYTNAHPARHCTQGAYMGPALLPVSLPIQAHSCGVRSLTHSYIIGGTWHLESNLRLDAHHMSCGNHILVSLLSIGLLV